MRKYPWGYTIFCDDIRQEIGGKYSLIGIYSENLVVHGEFPATIAKLALDINYIQEATGEKEPVTVKVFFPGDSEEAPTQIATIPVEAIQLEGAVPVSPDSGEILELALKFHVIVSPCVIQKSGLLKVRAIRGDREIKLGSLPIVGSAEASL